MNNFTFIPNAEHFQKIRSKTIGASDIPIILGLSNFSTPYDLWRQKTGRAEAFEENKATSWGHRHEPNILASYIEDAKDKQTANNFLIDYLKNIERRENYKPATNYLPFTEFLHPELKFALAHPDMVDAENEINIEAKSGSYFANMKRGDMDGYEKDNPDGYPLRVYLQCQWQMFVTRIKDTVLRALIDTNTELSYNITANKKIQEKLIDLASRFMWNVEKDKEPMPVNSDDIKKMFPKVQDKAAYLVGAESELAKQMNERKEFLSKKVKKYQSEIDDINDGLFLFIGGNKYLYDAEGNKICTQVHFESEKIKGIKEIKEAGLYDQLKEKDLIYNNEVRYVR